MRIKKSHIVFLICTLFICLALFARISERRLAADRDDWVRSDSTLTAHTIHCPEDSIQLECPPPWVKWYEVDFKDPETGECIFKDLGLMAANVAVEYGCSALDLTSGNKHSGNRPEYIAYASYTFSPDTNETLYTFTENFRLEMAVQKWKNRALFYSRKQSLIQLLEDQNNAPKESVFRRLDSLPQLIDEYYYQDSPAGTFEKWMGPAVTDPDTGWTGFRYPFGPRWRKGLWHTRIQTLGAVNGSIRQTFAFEDQVIERVMEYYRSLHSSDS